VNYFERWRFEPLECIKSGHCSTVWLSEDRALKVPFQGEEQTSGLAAALRLQAVGGPKVYEFDPETGALLMERIVPGNDARFLPDHEFLPIWADLVKRMSALGAHDLMPLEGYVGGQMLPSTRSFVHGDLHHENILWGGNRWTPIDPKGLAGEPCFEASALLTNPIHAIESADQWTDITRLRLEWLSKRFNWDPIRVLDWTIADRGTPEDSSNEEWKYAAVALRHLRTQLGG
jgi:hypothetical protein